MGKIKDAIMDIMELTPSERTNRPNTSEPNILSVSLKKPVATPDGKKDDTNIFLEDCLSCRIIGSTFLTGAGGSLMYFAYKRNANNKMKLRPVQRFSLPMVTICAGLGCWQLAIQRWTSSGVFDRQKQDWNIVHFLNGEVSFFLRLMHVPIPEFMEPPVKIEDNKGDKS